MFTNMNPKYGKLKSAMKTDKSIVLLFLLLFIACGKSEPIKIGFAGPLSGKNSEFGTEGRNGVIFAVEAANRNGGIAGRTVTLLTNDDKSDAAAAIKGDLRLIEEGVIAIIGHMTSAMSMAVMDIMNREKIVMISPTTSTELLSGIDDYFIRVLGTTKTEARSLAEHAVNNFNTKNVSYIYDLSNKAYTESWVRNFKSSHIALGGREIKSVTFFSGAQPEYTVLVEKLLADPVDAVCIAANASDTAMLCQQIRKKNTTLKILCCGWAQTKDIIIHGGHSVEGVLFSHQYSESPGIPRLDKFRKEYRQRFKNNAGFAAIFSYNAAYVLFDALRRDPNPKNLKKTILSKRIYQCIDKDILIDDKGDAETSYHLFSIHSQKFVEIE